MPRKHLYLSDDALEKLPQLAKDAGFSSIGAYVSRLIMEAAAHKDEDVAAMKEELESLRRAENSNGRNLSVLLEMMNTYFMMFATGSNNDVFYPIGENMHPWVKKAYEAVEAQLRMAKYNKVKGGD